MTDRVAIVGARDASPETLTKVREYVAALPKGTTFVVGFDSERLASDTLVSLLQELEQ